MLTTQVFILFIVKLWIQLLDDLVYINHRWRPAEIKVLVFGKYLAIWRIFLWICCPGASFHL